jgi:hypothetical protein
MIEARSQVCGSDAADLVALPKRQFPPGRFDAWGRENQLSVVISLDNFEFLWNILLCVVSSEKKMSLSSINPLASNLETAAVVAKGALRAAAHLKISNRRLADVVGLSGSSMSRLAQGTFQLDPSSKAFDLALLFIRLYRSLDAICGGDAVTASSWMRSDNLALGGRPLDLIMHVSGLTDVIAYLDARRAIV